ncbi:MAG: hypothetical protein J7603_21735 [Pseudacidovorax sp.]|nr:hypothetical protein [Pseudacidovorax sp.]
MGLRSGGVGQVLAGQPAEGQRRAERDAGRRILPAHHREAVMGGDAARAEQLMREHVYYAGLILRRNYEALLNAGKDAPGLRPSRRSDDGAPGAG